MDCNKNAQHRCATRFGAAMLQNKLQVFVARFTVPLVFMQTQTDIFYTV